jgi:hypothetical protein
LGGSACYAIAHRHVDHLPDVLEILDRPKQQRLVQRGAVDIPMCASGNV